MLCSDFSDLLNFILALNCARVSLQPFLVLVSKKFVKNNSVGTTIVNFVCIRVMYTLVLIYCLCLAVGFDLSLVFYLYTMYVKCTNVS